MRKIIYALTFLLLSLFNIELIYQDSTDACQRTGPVVLSHTCEISDFIIRAQAVKYAEEPKNPNIITSGIPDSKVEFKILEVLKGDSISGLFTLKGYLNNEDDFNDKSVPYNFVRKNGRGGSCYANTYKKDAEYLLFIKNTSEGFTVNIDPLAPVNEQLHSSDDPWVYYIKGLLKGLEESSNLKKKTQQQNITSEINCDSLKNKMYNSGYPCVFIENVPTLKISYAELQNNFLKIIDTINLKKTIYIEVYVDTLGNVHCPEIIKGNNNKLDSIAINYVHQLKFIPAIQGGKSFAMFIIIPLYSNEVKETPVLFRKNGKWYAKKKK